MRKIDELGFDDLGRPCIELYLMNLCFNVAKRALDPDTKCGCLVSDEFGGTLCTGYNGPPMGSSDELIPLTRPRKYVTVIHSEMNAILTAARRGICLEGSTFYITGLPCVNCLMSIIQVKAKKIVFGPLLATMLKDKEYMKYYPIILNNNPIEIRKFKYNEGLKKLSGDKSIINIINQSQDFNADWISNEKRRKR